jgi:uncharacterized protein (TIGR03032 family)
MTDAAPASSDSPFRYVYSPEFPGLLEKLNATLLVSTYQAGKLVVVRAVGGRLSMLLRTFDQAMGLAADHRRLTIGTRSQIWFLRNAPDLAPQIEPRGQHDACYLPRASHVTGDIRCHEIAWAGEELWIVNTRFSCLCTLDLEYSFVPRWQPPFVTGIAAEDRCHLNGLALVEGRPKYVTALGETDREEGWRDGKARGGCIIDVESNRIVARGLSMPHSPRWHAGRLWVLESGEGTLATIDPATGTKETIARFPGYTRGLAFCGEYAFVGLSRIRETSTFGGLPIAERLPELKCGVWGLNLATAQIEAFLEFQADVTELFDVQMLMGIRCPAVIGLQKDTLHGAFVVPRAQRSG